MNITTVELRDWLSGLQKGQTHEDNILLLVKDTVNVVTLGPTCNDLSYFIS